MFNEIGVNRVLYFLVFGESLLNGMQFYIYFFLTVCNNIHMYTHLWPDLGASCKSNWLYTVLTGEGQTLSTVHYHNIF